MKHRDRHIYAFLSVPKGDAEVVRFIGYCLKASFSFQIPPSMYPIIESAQTRLQKVVFEKEFYHPIDVCMGFYMQNDQENFRTYLSDFNYSTAFCMFMSLRLRLISNTDNTGFDTDLRRYASFHETENGIESEQYAIASVLCIEALFRQKKIKATEFEENLLCCVTHIQSKSMKGYVYWLLGSNQDFPTQKRYEFFIKVDASKYEPVAIKYIMAKEYANASWFALSAFEREPSQRTAALVSTVFCNLELRYKARAILLRVCPPKEAIKLMVPRNMVKTDERICMKCSKLDPLGRTHYIRCALCREDWYCSQECANTDSNHHGHCRFCHGCDVFIAKPQKRQYCSGCHVSFYCSKECQLNHWNASHKKECLKRNL